MGLGGTHHNTQSTRSVCSDLLKWVLFPRVAWLLWHGRTGRCWCTKIACPPGSTWLTVKHTGSVCCFASFWPGTCLCTCSGVWLTPLTASPCGGGRCGRGWVASGEQLVLFLPMCYRLLITFSTPGHVFNDTWVWRTCTGRTPKAAEYSHESCNHGMLSYLIAQNFLPQTLFCNRRSTGSQLPCSCGCTLAAAAHQFPIKRSKHHHQTHGRCCSGGWGWGMERRLFSGLDRKPDQRAGICCTQRLCVSDT